VLEKKNRRVAGTAYTVVSKATALNEHVGSNPTSPTSVAR